MAAVKRWIAVAKNVDGSRASSGLAVYAIDGKYKYDWNTKPPEWATCEGGWFSLRTLKEDAWIHGRLKGNKVTNAIPLVHIAAERRTWSRRQRSQRMEQSPSQADRLQADAFITLRCESTCWQGPEAFADLACGQIMEFKLDSELM